VVFTNHGGHAVQRATSVVRVHLEPSTTLRENGGSRAAVWTGTALFELPCHRLVWQKLVVWVAAWQAAGFQDIVLHARDAQMCETLKEHLQGAKCMPTPSQPGSFPDVPQANDVMRDYLDQALLNMVGLVQTRAAGYKLIAFVDVDELPPVSVEPLKDALAALAAEEQWSHTSVFVRQSVCSPRYCPKSRSELMDALASGKCNGTQLLHGAGNVPPLDTVTKVIGVPARMTSVKVHSAAPGLGVGAAHQFAACLQHPVVPFERDIAACPRGTNSTRRLMRAHGEPTGTGDTRWMTHMDERLRRRRRMQ